MTQIPLSLDFLEFMKQRAYPEPRVPAQPMAAVPQGGIPGGGEPDYGALADQIIAQSGIRQTAMGMPGQGFGESPVFGGRGGPVPLPPQPMPGPISSIPLDDFEQWAAGRSAELNSPFQQFMPPVSPEAQALMNWQRPGPSPQGQQLPPSSPQEVASLTAHNQAMAAGRNGGGFGGNQSLQLGDAMGSGRGFGPDVSMPGGRQMDPTAAQTLASNLEMAQRRQREREDIRRRLGSGDADPALLGSANYMDSQGQSLWSSKQNDNLGSLVPNNRDKYMPNEQRQQAAKAESDARKARLALRGDRRSGINPLMRMLQQAAANGEGLDPTTVAMLAGPGAGNVALGEQQNDVRGQLGNKELDIRDAERKDKFGAPGQQIAAIGTGDPNMLGQVQQGLGATGMGLLPFASQQALAAIPPEVSPQVKLERILSTPGVAGDPQQMLQAASQIGLTPSDVAAMIQSMDPSQQGFFGSWGGGAMLTENQGPLNALSRAVGMGETPEQYQVRQQQLQAARQLLQLMTGGQQGVPAPPPMQLPPIQLDPPLPPARPNLPPPYQGPGFR